MLDLSVYGRIGRGQLEDEPGAQKNSDEVEALQDFGKMVEVGLCENNRVDNQSLDEDLVENTRGKVTNFLPLACILTARKRDTTLGFAMPVKVCRRHQVRRSY